MYRASKEETEKYGEDGRIQVLSEKEDQKENLYIFSCLLTLIEGITLECHYCKIEMIHESHKIINGKRYCIWRCPSCQKRATSRELLMCRGKA